MDNKDINSFEYFEEMTNDWSRIDLLKRCYDLCNGMVEKQQEIERLNNIINTILEFDFFKNNCPLDFSYTEKSNEDEAQNVFYEDAYCEENCSNEFKKCWLKYFEELQELKGSNEPSFEEMVNFVENVCKDIKSQSTLDEELKEERERIAKIVDDFKGADKE